MCVSTVVRYPWINNFHRKFNAFENYLVLIWNLTPTTGTGQTVARVTSWLLDIRIIRLRQVVVRSVIHLVTLVYLLLRLVQSIRRVALTWDLCRCSVFLEISLSIASLYVKLILRWLIAILYSILPYIWNNVRQIILPRILISIWIYSDISPTLRLLIRPLFYWISQSRRWCVLCAC